MTNIRPDWDSSLVPSGYKPSRYKWAISQIIPNLRSSEWFNRYIEAVILYLCLNLTLTFWNTFSRSKTKRSCELTYHTCFYVIWLQSYSRNSIPEVGHLGFRIFVIRRGDKKCAQPFLGSDWLEDSKSILTSIWAQKSDGKTQVAWLHRGRPYHVQGWMVTSLWRV